MIFLLKVKTLGNMKENKLEKEGSIMIDNAIQRIEALDFFQTFIIDDISGKSLSYNEFFTQGLFLASFINDVIAGNTVIAIKENSIELALLYFAVMLTDKKIMVIDPQKGMDEICSILSNVEQTGLFTESNIKFKDDINQNLIEIPSMENLSYSISDVQKVVINKLQTRALNAPYLVTFTSGTSGISKGVEHTLDNLFRTAMALDEKVGKEGGTFLHVMPMTYMAGILNSLFYPFLIGARIVIAKRFSIISARKFWNITSKYNADLFWLSPSMLMMIDQLDRTHIGEEYCKNKELTFLIGTAPLTNEMRTKFNGRYGVEVYASYGLSETLFISVENDVSMARSQKNSVGELLSGVEYMFSQSGEIYINVPWMFLGYTNENTERYFEGSYYKTGDLAEVKKGCLYITGRSKDLIIRGGMNISPVLIENAVYKDERIAENVVFGVKDRSGEEKVCCAYIVSGELDNQQALESNIKKLVINNLGKNYMLDYIWKIEEIPRNINGKIDKKLLKQIWENNNV